MKKKPNTERLPLSNRLVDFAIGLDEAQIQERQEKGYINDIKVGTSKSVGKIFAGNIFTFFNLLCLLIFIWIVSVSESIEDFKNTTFMGVIIINTAIGIVQELKAKAKMDELSLLSSPTVSALRMGETKSIKLNEILLDDIITLSAGDQICTDSIVIEGELEVNESLLTGESLPVKKEKGDKLLSGSFVVSGKAKSQVEHIGVDNYIQQLAQKAKELGDNKSELVRSIKLIMRIIGIIILPIAALAFLNNLNAQLLQINETAAIFQPNGALFESIPHLMKFINSAPPEAVRLAYKESVVYTSAAMIGMIPVGMFLLTSVALAVGIIRLAKKKALVQNLYSIEALARVNMLCLDKTGTITDGTMRVTEFVCLRENKFKYPIEEIVGAMQKALDEDNMTAKALKEYFSSPADIEAEFVVPFSSDRKANAVRFGGIGLCVLGAPEYVTRSMAKPLAAKIEEYQAKGNRCLLFGINTTKAAEEKRIPEHSTPYAIIVIEDNIKSEAVETIKLFKQNGVDVRVISGDNPLTVSEVAKRVGIENAEKYLSLQDVSDDEIREKALDYTVFGRVNPTQKKLLIEIFKQSGKTVAMTGDGVNDILALKEADCSIAMANGSEATRNVAQLVLLDSNFGSMPAIVNEGRRVINNIERTSSLFLTKTLFSFLLLFCLIVSGMSYPIEPVQLTFTSLFIIGFASFVLALEPNNNKIKGTFVKNIMKNVLPPAISIVVAVLVIMAMTKNGWLHVPKGEYQTIITYAIFGVFLLVLYNISKPFNTVRKVLFITVLGLGLSCAIFMPMLPQSLNLFKLSKLSSLVSFTLLFSVIFLAENVIKIVDFTIKRYALRKEKV
jgi:cation-transporting ATPase E